MTALRDSRDRRATWAHGILDGARAGLLVPARDINRALRILGDLS